MIRSAPTSRPLKVAAVGINEMSVGLVANDRPVADLPHLQGISRKVARHSHNPEPAAKLASTILTRRTGIRHRERIQCGRPGVLKTVCGDTVHFEARVNGHA